MVDLRQMPQDVIERAGEIVSRVSHLEAPRVVEVGMFGGAMSAAIKTMNPDIVLYSVDNWLPAEEQPEAYKETNDFCVRWDEEKRKSLRENAYAIAKSHGIEIIEMDSVDAAEQFENESLDLAFLDADHSFLGLSQDIAAWQGKVKPGGYLGGHDYNNLREDAPFDFGGVHLAVNGLAHSMKLPLELGDNFTWFIKAPV